MPAGMKPGISSCVSTTTWISGITARTTPLTIHVCSPPTTRTRCWLSSRRRSRRRICWPPPHQPTTTPPAAFEGPRLLAPPAQTPLLAPQQAPLETQDLLAPGEPAHEHAHGHGQVEQEDDAPEPHQCTCSSGGRATAVSWLSAWISASSTLMSDQPGGGPPGSHRARR